MVAGTCERSASAGFLQPPSFLVCFVMLFCFRLMMSADHHMVLGLACRGMAPFLASLSLRCSVHLQQELFLMIATSAVVLAFHLGLVGL